MENPTPAFTTPLVVTAVDGEVAITGPGGLCASLTVEAAVASAERLLAAARTLILEASADNDVGSGGI